MTDAESRIIFDAVSAETDRIAKDFFLYVCYYIHCVGCWPPNQQAEALVIPMAREQIAELRGRIPDGMIPVLMACVPLSVMDLVRLTSVYLPSPISAMYEKALQTPPARYWSHKPEEKTVKKRRDR